MFHFHFHIFFLEACHGGCHRTRSHLITRHLNQTINIINVLLIIELVYVLKNVFKHFKSVNVYINIYMYTNIYAICI